MAAGFADLCRDCGALGRVREVDGNSVVTRVGCTLRRPVVECSGPVRVQVERVGYGWSALAFAFPALSVLLLCYVLIFVVV